MIFLHLLCGRKITKSRHEKERLREARQRGDDNLKLAEQLNFNRNTAYNNVKGEQLQHKRGCKMYQKVNYEMSEFIVEILEENWKRKR